MPTLTPLMVPNGTSVVTTVPVSPFCFLIDQELVVHMPPDGSHQGQ